MTTDRQSFHVQGNMDIRLFAHLVMIIEHINDGQLPFEAHTVSGVQRQVFQDLSDMFLGQVQFPTNPSDALSYLRKVNFQGKQITMTSSEGRNIIGRHLTAESMMESKGAATRVLETLNKAYPDTIQELDIERKLKDQEGIKQMDSELGNGPKEE